MVELNGTGVLIEGESGSGKTSLALGLVERAGLQGLPAHFVCDDQALLWEEDGRLFAHAPPAIAGKVEIRGLGIDHIDHKPTTTISLICSLADDDCIERLPEPSCRRILSMELPLLMLPRRHEEQAARIVLGRLRANCRTPQS